MKIAIIGAGWAGLAAAVTATQAGHNATVLEATHAYGGRARGLNVLKNCTLPNGTPVTLDNGQHILIGAYTETLKLMRQVGVNPAQALLSTPMALLFPQGEGIRFKDWPTPLDALGGILAARGWSLGDKASLLRASVGWRLQGFSCAADVSVAELCRALTPRINAELIEPLCVSALNTPAERASAQVFLRVLRDALFGMQGGSRLLLPRVDLSALFPDAAAAWLQQHGGQVRLGQRVETIKKQGESWWVDGEVFDAVILATSASNAALALMNNAQAATQPIANKMQTWAMQCQALRFEAIATVYAWAADAKLAHPMLALRSSPPCPAQFAFDRGQLGGPAGLLAFVVSAAEGDRATLEAQVLAQAQAQLGLSLQAVQTVVEKRATFACTPGLQRPPTQIAPGLLACGDYVAGPYPATLEGAVRSGQAAAHALAA
ncbi:MAG: hydroxysqualene dehydroxylase HpnE [Rhodoferax sp.]|uniref:hydroxysqualene dehydroxylase HpnE n=1 Tax=Rhodoferax sp. TaxID=50421 RepID=UPI0026267D4E|nr:hydroxysqualene dehydroxylase HpnE [Rhodoferax sp.]MDD2878984.1 hydroxysqualene dehydroxylase HpnE [Rhodoferax sp.]